MTKSENIRIRISAEDKAKIMGALKEHETLSALMLKLVMEEVAKRVQ